MYVIALPSISRPGRLCFLTSRRGHRCTFEARVFSTELEADAELAEIKTAMSYRAPELRGSLTESRMETARVMSLDEAEAACAEFGEHLRIREMW